jgi:hypothetical protein
MDAMYETSPSPTVLGYWMHRMPHAYHVLEIAFTFAAELLAPLLTVFGGRRGRWIALALWTMLQVSIQLTCGFGWLNTAAIGLGLLLLDDRMVAIAAAKLRWPALRDPFIDRPSTVVRMRRYRQAFTDAATLRRTGHYWSKEFAGDYLPAMYFRSRAGSRSSTWMPPMPP